MRLQSIWASFRIAVLAIAGMIVVSGAGAVSSLFLIDNSAVAGPSGMAALRAAATDPGDDWLDGWCWRDDVSDLLPTDDVVQDMVDWAGFDDATNVVEPASAAAVRHARAMTAAEITFPILTVLAVVATAQRLSGSGPRPEKPRDG